MVNRQNKEKNMTAYIDIKTTIEDEGLRIKLDHSREITVIFLKREVPVSLLYLNADQTKELISALSFVLEHY